MRSAAGVVAVSLSASEVKVLARTGSSGAGVAELGVCSASAFADPAEVDISSSGVGLGVGTGQGVGEGETIWLKIDPPNIWRGVDVAIGLVAANGVGGGGVGVAVGVGVGVADCPAEGVVRAFSRAVASFGLMPLPRGVAFEVWFRLDARRIVSRRRLACVFAFSLVFPLPLSCAFFFEVVPVFAFGFSLPLASPLSAFERNFFSADEEAAPSTLDSGRSLDGSFFGTPA